MTLDYVMNHIDLATLNKMSKSELDEAMKPVLQATRRRLKTAQKQQSPAYHDMYLRATGGESDWSKAMYEKHIAKGGDPDAFDHHIYKKSLRPYLNAVGDEATGKITISYTPSTMTKTEIRHELKELMRFLNLETSTVKGKKEWEQSRQALDDTNAFAPYTNLMNDYISNPTDDIAESEKRMVKADIAKAFDNMNGLTFSEIFTSLSSYNSFLRNYFTSGDLAREIRIVSKSKGSKATVMEEMYNQAMKMVDIQFGEMPGGF